MNSFVELLSYSGAIMWSQAHCNQADEAQVGKISGFGNLKKEAGLKKDCNGRVQFFMSISFSTLQRGEGVVVDKIK